MFYFTTGTKKLVLVMHPVDKIHKRSKSCHKSKKYDKWKQSEEPGMHGLERPESSDRSIHIYNSY